MTVAEVMKRLDLEIVAGHKAVENTVNTGFVGDLLSVVMGKAKDENAWITIQSHVNIVAVALLTGVSCIIVSEGFKVEDDAIEKANEEDIPVLTTKKSSYEIAVELSKVLEA